MKGVGWAEGKEGMSGSRGLCRLAWLEQRQGLRAEVGGLGRARGLGTFQLHSEKFEIWMDVNWKLRPTL